MKFLSYPLFTENKGWYPWVRYTLVVIFFALVATIYFLPATFEGRDLFRTDVEAVSGNGSDAKTYNESHPDDTSYWTNSLFGGMPMYQIAPSYPSIKVLEKIEGIYDLRYPLPILGSYPWLLFALMIGFFIFMKSLKVSDILAILGALLWAFSSYFVILIGAGHIWKLMTLAYIPPSIGGMILLYRKKYLLGVVTLALFASIQLMANHMQMTYYFLFVMIAIFIAFAINAIQKKGIKSFAKATGLALVAGLIAIAINSTNLYHTYSYSKETMRGGSELTLSPTEHIDSDSFNPVASKGQGLNKEYITQWSYGIGETWSLLVPNIRGGASEPLSRHAKHLDKASPLIKGNLANMSAYWGEQPFTAGPVYVGVFVVMLFLLGTMVVKGPIKWILFILTIFSILLSWGKNFMPLTNFFIDYIPLYNKFRAVSSILVIAEFTIPTLAILGLVKLIENPSILKEKKYIPIVAFGVPLFFLLLMAIAPGLFGNFLSGNESQQLSQLSVSNPAYVEFANSLQAVRRSMLQSDAWRAILVAILSLLPLYFFLKRKLSNVAFVTILGVISFIDLWSICKRYLHDDMFANPKTHTATIQPTSADLEILKDKDPSYRVLNLSVNTFNDASTSRWHRSIGGYHAAKLQRYQDLIDHQLSKMNPEVLNMLNTKYIIAPNPSTGIPEVHRNPDAFGSAWFAKKIEIVDNANEEMLALGKGSLKEKAIIDKRFLSDDLKALPPFADSTALLSLLKYTPKEMIYKVNLNQSALALFSQIYYPYGWKAEIIDSNKSLSLSVLRANYILQGIILPQGSYNLRIHFDPVSIKVTETIAKCAFILLVLLALGAIILPIYQAKKKKKREEENFIVEK